MRVDKLLAAAAARLVVIDPETPLRDAAFAFSKPRIGLLVVADQSGRAVGVVTKSDIVRHLAHGGEMAAAAQLFMSKAVTTCAPDDDLQATCEKMLAQALQNMPVLCTASRPLGVLGLREGLKALLEQEAYEGELLVNYVRGVGYQ